MAGRTIDASGAGLGDAVVGLWIAEGAKAVGETIPFVESVHDDVMHAFGHVSTSERSEDCMVLGSGSFAYDEELRTAEFDSSPRPTRWQSSLGWDYPTRRPPLGSLPAEAVEWAESLTQERPVVVIAPKANFDYRSLPIQKWIRVAWDLKRLGIRTVAIDGARETVQPFPFFAFGFSWTSVLALLARADVVAGNDSGIPHIAATIGVPTVAAMGPTHPNVVFGHCQDVLTPVTSATIACTGCHFVGSKGYMIACDHGCDALQSIPWQRLRDAILEKLGSSSRESSTQ